MAGFWQVIGTRTDTGEVEIADVRSKRSAVLVKHEMEQSGKYRDIIVWNTRENSLSDLLRFS
jgi:hypothetical protein